MSLDNPGLSEERIRKEGLDLGEGYFCMPGNLKVKLSAPEHREGLCRYSETCKKYQVYKPKCNKNGGSIGAVDVTERCYTPK